MTLLWCGPFKVEVDDSVLALAGDRCLHRSFITEGAADFCLKRVATHSPGARPLKAQHSSDGCVALKGNTLEAHLPDTLYPAELALRVLYQVALARAGAVLAHSAGIAVGEQAVVALGLSGAGKTTFSTLAVEYGGARLLSDEICALFPDGRVYGTPFRSDGQCTPTPEVAQLKSILVLRKEPFERIEPVNTSTVLPALLTQTYRPFVAEELSATEAFGRLSATAAQVGVRAFAFRKHPAAGRFIADWVRNG
ncbi:MAG: hypothetical protein K1X64_08790 [Myxococcaceae bacterium]|nr:hypothetical protein [Myxococcaceae bacterium]